MWEDHAMLVLCERIMRGSFYVGGSCDARFM